MKFKNAIYAHEHIALDLSTPERPERVLNKLESTRDEFILLKQLGVSRIVDLTAKGMGRNIASIVNLRELTQLDITVATGYYKKPYLPQEVYDNDVNALAKLMLNEIYEGIEYHPDKKKVKATVIGEIGTSLNEITQEEYKIFSASAIVQKNSLLPLVTHTTLATMALEQIDLLRSFEVDLTKVVISHMDLSNSLEYIIKVLDSGVNIGFDTIGKLNYKSDDTRAKYLLELCQRGYVSQIVMSVDITANAQLKDMHGIGYAYLIEQFIPKLSASGVKEMDIRTITEDNPNRIFARSFKDDK